MYFFFYYRFFFFENFVLIDRLIGYFVINNLIVDYMYIVVFWFLFIIGKSCLDFVKILNFIRIFCYCWLDIGILIEIDSLGCFLVEGRAGCDLVKRFGYSFVMLRDKYLLVSFGGFGEEVGKYCRILDLIVIDIWIF